MKSTEYKSPTTIRTIDHGSKTIPTIDDAPTLCKKITVSNTVVTDLLESLRSCEQRCTPSLLYSKNENLHLIGKKLNKNARKSISRNLVSTELFDLGEELLRSLDLSVTFDSSLKFGIMRDNVANVIYQIDDFFLPHQDAISTSTDLINTFEFTLIICVTPPKQDECIGGRTKVYFGSDILTFDTNVLGNALLIRKDLVHEAEMLVSGQKEILMFNILGTKHVVKDVKQKVYERIGYLRFKTKCKL